MNADPQTARDDLIGFCLAASPNEVAFERAGRLADAYRAAVLAAAARVVSAAPDDGLRDRIAEALIRWSYRGQEPDPETGILETVRANAYSRADAVLGVLPAPADRAAVLREAADLVAADTGFHIRYGSATDYAEHYAALLRRMADEEQQPETRRSCACGQDGCEYCDVAEDPQ